MKSVSSFARAVSVLFLLLTLLALVWNPHLVGLSATANLTVQPITWE